MITKKKQLENDSNNGNLWVVLLFCCLYFLPISHHMEFQKYRSIEFVFQRIVKNRKSHFALLTIYVDLILNNKLTFPIVAKVILSVIFAEWVSYSKIKLAIKFYAFFSIHNWNIRKSSWSLSDFRIVDEQTWISSCQIILYTLSLVLKRPFSSLSICNDLMMHVHICYMNTQNIE